MEDFEQGLGFVFMGSVETPGLNVSFDESDEVASSMFSGFSSLGYYHYR